MFDDVLFAEEVHLVIEGMSPRYRDFVLCALQEDDVEKISEIGMSMTGELHSSSIIIGLGASSKKHSLWSKVVEETYKAVCTESDEYKEERIKGVGVFQSLVTVISTSVASSVSASIGIVTGLVTVALIGVAKIGKNAWCNLNTPPVV